MSMKAELNVEKTSWNHSKDAVEKRLNALDGIQSFNVDLGAKRIIVSYDGNKTNLVDIKEAILDEGYTIVEA